MKKFWMHGIFSAFLVIGGTFTLFGCATANTEERLNHLETQMSSQIVLDMRLTQTEERLTSVEHAIGELKDSLDGKGKRAGARQSAAMAAPDSSPVAPSPATLTQAENPVLPSGTVYPPLQPGPADIYPDQEAEPLGSDGLPFPQSLDTYQLLPGGRRVEPQPSHQPAGVAPATTPNPPAALSSAVGGTPEKNAYSEALGSYEKKRFSLAEQQFKQFLEKYPQSKLAPNAAYWLGECYYSTGRMDLAILEFKDIAGKFPRHDKAAAALLKAGYAYASMNDTENARFYWEILIDDFPASQPAALAKKRLAALPR